MDSLALPSADLKEQLSTLPTQELRGELSRLLGLTAQNLLRLAVIVSVLEDRGEDLSALKGGFLNILRKIACGELLPDIVVLFSGEPAKIIQAAKLPVEEQKEIANGNRQFPIEIRARRLIQAPPPKTQEEIEEDDTTEAELNAMIEERRRTMPTQASAPKKAVDPLAGVRVGNPKDVGESAAEMILACSDRAAALAQFVIMLERSGMRIAEPVAPAPKPVKPYPPGYWVNRTKHEEVATAEPTT